MAISKTQSERPAIIALIDAVNETEPIVAQNVQDIATLTEGLADEVNNRETADTRLDEAVQDEVVAREQAIQDEVAAREQAIQDEVVAREQAVQGIDDKIGEGVFSSSFTVTQGFRLVGAELQDMSNAVDDINQWQERFRIGLSANIAVVAGSSTSSTLAFGTPFDSSAEVAVFPVCVDGSGNFTDLSCKLISANYSGFSFAVYNDTQADVSTKVGFLAVKVN